MLREVIQVEVINPWWSEALPILAIVISVGTLVWSIIDRNGAKAKILVRDGFSDSLESRLLFVYVRNEGRVESTVISDVSIKFPHSGGPGWLVVEPELENGQLPQRIEPGETLQFKVDGQEIVRVAAESGTDFKAIEFDVYYGHGHVSMPISDILVTRLGIWQTT